MALRIWTGANGMKHKLFYIGWLAIGFISAYDTYLGIKFKSSLYLMEENPIGRWLITLDNKDVALFMGLKFAGTVLVLGILCLLPNRYKIPSTISIFIIQLLVLFYLLI